MLKDQIRIISNLVDGLVSKIAGEKIVSCLPSVNKCGDDMQFFLLN